MYSTPWQRAKDKDNSHSLAHSQAQTMDLRKKHQEKFQGVFKKKIQEPEKITKSDESKPWETHIGNFSEPLPSERMEHSAGPLWNWVDSQDFVKYLIENKYVARYGVASLPHDGSHGICGSCQIRKIIDGVKRGIDATK